ncbi:MAG: OsmC family protein [Pseudomonadota bacterium]
MPIKDKANGLDLKVIGALVEKVAADSAEGETSWKMVTEWTGGARNASRLGPIRLGSGAIDRDVAIEIDEPVELGGTNRSANPQEHLLAAVNACILTTFVAQCALRGVALESARIETEGDIDLQGFFGLAHGVAPGFEGLSYHIVVKGDGLESTFAEIHDVVKATSPNYFVMTNKVALNSRLTVA